MLNIAHIYTMKYTGDLDYTFPNTPVLGNSLIYVFSFMGESVATTDSHYNNGLGPHDLDLGYLVSSGHTLSPALTGGNGATVEIIWTQCIQDAAFNTVHFKAKEAGSGLDVVTYLTIYEIEGAIGQTPGVGSSTNFNPTLDWNEGSTTTADASLIALGSHMTLKPDTFDCSCPPPGNCGANDHQAKFTLGADFGTVIGQEAIPGCDFFHICDPCDPAYVQNDFIFAVNSNGAADALTLTDNIQGTWIIDYQIDGQIFGHLGPVVPTTGSIRIVKATVPGGAAQPFTFRPSWGGSFVLHDGQSNDSGALAPGTYSITEDAVANWNTVVTGGDPTNIVVTPGSSITLLFTNTFVPPAKGRIIVHKVTDPVADPQGFTFRPSWGAPFVLGDGQQNDSGPLDAGTYAVTEDPVDGWTTETSQDPSTIVVEDGSNTDITFTNTKTPICIVQPPETGVMKFARGIGDLNNEMLALEVSNEAVPGAWFELHEMVLYARPSAQSRKG